jgi:hypothetical protein
MPLRLLPLVAALLSGCPTPGDDDDTSSSGDCTDIQEAQDPPRVDIQDPSNQTLFALGDTINFVAEVADGGSALEDIGVELFDVINVQREAIAADPGSPSADGDIAFSLAAADVGAGQHVLLLVVTDTDGCEGSDDVYVCVDTADCQ